MAPMDSMIDLGHDEPPAPGMLSANFYVSTDGTRAINYAEWINEAAHQAMIDRSRSTRARGIIENTPTVRPVGFTRYLWWHSIPAPLDHHRQVRLGRALAGSTAP